MKPKLTKQQRKKLVKEAWKDLPRKKKLDECKCSCICHILPKGSSTTFHASWCLYGDLSWAPKDNNSSIEAKLDRILEILEGVFVRKAGGYEFFTKCS